MQAGGERRTDEAKREKEFSLLAARRRRRRRRLPGLARRQLDGAKQCSDRRMSSLFGNRAGAISSPSDSAAKAQQIKQEVAQQLGARNSRMRTQTQVESADQIRTPCSPRERAGTHQRA